MNQKHFFKQINSNKTKQNVPNTKKQFDRTTRKRRFIC